MKAFVVIEWTGNAHEVDGAIIHGVYVTGELAQAYRASLSKSVQRWMTIEEHDLRSSLAA